MTFRGVSPSHLMSEPAGARFVTMHHRSARSECPTEHGSRQGTRV